MNILRFFLHHSLIGYLLCKIKRKWFTPPTPPLPAQINHHGVLLQVDCLPQGMQKVLYSGNYERSEIALLPELVSAEDKILEIGAAIGFLGLYCRKVLGIQELVSVEPNPKTVSYLRLNYELNGLTPSVMEAAVAAADGPIQLNTSDMFWADSIVSASDPSVSQVMTVEGLSLSSIIERAGIEFTTLVIDVEGGEKYLPLAHLPECITKILIEIHPGIIGTRASYQVIETLVHSGFKIQNQCRNVWALVRD